MSKQSFGGNWTEEKLARLRKYLPAYVHVLKNKGLTYTYIDAFAGTGYRELRDKELQGETITTPLFPELSAQETQNFMDGSARIALQTEPRFHKYIFIEKDRSKIPELSKLKEQFPDNAEDIQIVNGDANTFLINLCRTNWHRNRAVLFLDPFGMQIPWSTIEAIANTQAIDLWYLFPLGIAVNRLLTKDGNIQPAWQRRLDDIFGTSDWFEAFYQPVEQQNQQLSLFDIGNSPKEQIEKVANFDSISKFFVERLKTIFAGVADNPLVLRNSCNNPLYLLCFASGNPRGSKTAIKIAQDILKN